MYIYQKSGNTRLLVIERTENETGEPSPCFIHGGIMMMKMNVNVELPEVLPASKDDFLRLLLELVVKK